MMGFINDTNEKVKDVLSESRNGGLSFLLRVLRRKIGNKVYLRDLENLLDQKLDMDKEMDDLFYMLGRDLDQLGD